MAKFAIGDVVRQRSTEATGKVIGVHPSLPPSDSTAYTVRFTLGGHQSSLPEDDLELFNERRIGFERRINPARRHVIAAKDQGQCVLESLSRVLKLPLADVRRMFEEFSGGQKDPSLINHMVDVLMEGGYVVGQISKSRAEEKGECCFVALSNDSGAGHVVVVCEDNKVFDPEHKFNESGGSFYGQCMALGWKVDHVLVFRKL